MKSTEEKPCSRGGYSSLRPLLIYDTAELIEPLQRQRLSICQLEICAETLAACYYRAKTVVVVTASAVQTAQEGANS